MQVSDLIVPGVSREETFRVEEQHTAYHIGSGDEKVLGTPWMISFMERVSNRLVAENLSKGQMSVGVHVDVRHLAATPMNVEIRVRAEVLEVVKPRASNLKISMGGVCLIGQFIQHLLHRLFVFSKSIASILGQVNHAVWFLANNFFFDRNVAVIFQFTEVG